MERSFIPKSPAFLLPILMVAATACAQDQEASPPEDVMEAEAETEAGVEVPAYAEEVRTAFEPPAGSESDVTGVLRLMVPTQAVEDPEEAPLMIHAELSGLEPGEYPWYVFGMPCGMEGDALVPVGAWDEEPSQAIPLQVPEGGSVEVEAPVPELSERWTGAGNYSVRIFETLTMEEGSMVACANL